MVLRKEIEILSAHRGVNKSTIDKDWVLGHFVDAIFSVSKCRKDLVFKGGTYLKKCRYPNYRFSEDLDFTSLNPEFIFDRKLLNEIVKIVTNRTGIPLYIKEIKDLELNDVRTGFCATVKFWGADHAKNQLPPPPTRWTTSIKIEIILYEKVFFEIEYWRVIHDYSDSLSKESESIPCYSISEVLAEKLRALIQRSYTAPRDVYDIWYLANNTEGLDWTEIKEAFYYKMELKGLVFKGVDQMINPENDKRLKAAWQNSLAHQIKPQYFSDYELVRDELKELLTEIFS